MPLLRSRAHARRGLHRCSARSRAGATSGKTPLPLYRLALLVLIHMVACTNPAGLRQTLSSGNKIITGLCPSTVWLAACSPRAQHGVLVLREVHRQAVRRALGGHEGRALGQEGREAALVAQCSCLPGARRNLPAVSAIASRCPCAHTVGHTNTWKRRSKDENWRLWVMGPSDGRPANQACLVCALSAPAVQVQGRRPDLKHQKGPWIDGAC